MECIWPLGATLGEGPLWDVDTQALWFVDIKQGRIHRCNGDGSDRGTFEVGGMPSFILPRAGGGFVVGDRSTLHHFDGERIVGEIGRVGARADNRFNDATTDARGRLWFGSMDNLEAERSGVVHVHVDGAIHMAGGEAVITNGPAVSGDARWLYHVDTVERAIWRFDVADTNQLRDGEVFVRIEDGAGNPDGVTIDAADHVWVGLWGGWAARRYAPDGTLVQEVRLPVANITKLAFGGPDLKTAFATTARAGLDDAALAEQPLAGGIFRFAVDVPGAPVTPARLDA
ncbi:SMP-30/gluconolactonase/LRE family protein [Sphingomonas sp. CGMCC 1.13654]|uniref:SMP-30/gluconolactonase/LRE family protein n=1 Tax=Sphingomonas chungangi TaxID=2683589 RepID=A0A838LAW8_9SPHN|nr:SMP-30/gluconolactonase/LRE family protein [Sphingomonas chungangi]MBA2936177.1 SMP-30/gluconolactonase/LRE family protein [Sphingomonas chungangi]MVW55563.1 SMP-30/gluconolactonase/LRE family protein [Sphingomonas chungangi]